MRKKTYKGRCEKRKLEKFEGICKTYDPIQYAYADILSARESTYKKQLKGKGVIEPDFQERGAHDYRKDACLTLKQFEQIILHCIIYYNNHRIIDFPFTEAMIAAEVKPYASNIFHWGRKQLGANLMDVDAKKLIQVLLPRATGKFTRKGLVVNGLR